MTATLDQGPIWTVRCRCGKQTSVIAWTEAEALQAAVERIGWRRTDDGDVICRSTHGPVT